MQKAFDAPHEIYKNILFHPNRKKTTLIFLKCVRWNKQRCTSGDCHGNPGICTFCQHSGAPLKQAL